MIKSLVKHSVITSTRNNLSVSPFNALKIDNDGNIYQLVNTNYDANIGIWRTNYNPGLVKFDSEGNKLWEKNLYEDLSFHHAEIKYSTALANTFEIDKNNGSIYLVGYARNNWLGTGGRGKKKEYYIWTAKYNSNGEKQWIQANGEGSMSLFATTSLSSEGYIFEAGYKRYDIETSNWTNGIYIQKRNTDGEYQFAFDNQDPYSASG